MAQSSLNSKRQAKSQARSVTQASLFPRLEAFGAMIERPWGAALALLAWALLLLLPGITLFPVNDRDEAKFGRAAIEMAERNEWLIPTFGNDFVLNPDKELELPEWVEDEGKTKLKSQGDYRFDKPVGVYWLMRLSLEVFGEKQFVDAQGKPIKSDQLFDTSALEEAKSAGRVKYLPTPRTDAALRLPSILSSWVVALVVFALGRQLYTARAGLLAAFAWLSCLQVMIHGRLIVADMPMIAAVCVAMWAAWKLLFGKAVFDKQEQLEQLEAQGVPQGFIHWKSGWWWLWVLALAWGFLVKGPIAWAVPVAALLLMRWVFLRREMGSWRWRKLAPVSTSVLVLVLVGLWAIPANIATNWEYTKVGLGEHVVERSVSSFNGRGSIPFVYYLLLAPISLLPWGGLIPVALRRKNSAEKRDPRRAFLLGWLLAPYLIFSPLSTQLPHYVLPGFPAFFLLLMRFGWPKVKTKLEKYWLFSVWLIVLLLAGVIFFAVSQVTWMSEFDKSLGIDYRGRNEQVEGFRVLLLSIAALLVVLSSVLALSQLKKPFLWVTICLLVCAFLTHELARGLRMSSPTIAFTKVLQEQEGYRNGGEGESYRYLRSWKYGEPSRIYYAARDWSRGGSEKTLKRWMGDLDEQFLLVKYRSWRLDWATIQSLWRKEPPKASEDYDALLRAQKEQMEDFSFIPIQGYNPATSQWVKLYVIVEQRLSAEAQSQMTEMMRRKRRDQAQGLEGDSLE